MTDAVEIEEDFYEPPPLTYAERTPLMDLCEDVDECYETPVLLLGVVKRLLFEVDRLNREVSRLHGEAP